MDCVAINSEVVVVVVVVVVTASSTLKVYSLLVWQGVEECVIGISIVTLTYKLISLTTASHSFDFKILKTDIVWALFHYHGHHQRIKQGVIFLRFGLVKDSILDVIITL